MTHPVLERLASADAAERRAACLAAAEDPSGTLLAPALGEALGDASREVARAASDALVAIARRSGDVDDVVRDALRTAEGPRRFAAAFTLARLEPPGPGLLPVLVDALADADGDTRWAAARILVEMGRMHGEVLPTLVGLLASDARPVVRRMCAHALRALAPERPEAADSLLAATRDEELAVRRAVLTAVGALHDPPPPLRARLAEIADGDADPASRRLASLALERLGPAHTEERAP